MKKMNYHKRITLTKVFPLVLFLLFLGLSYNSTAQGWTFQLRVGTSGPCATVTIIPELTSLPNLGLPTQSYCESLRAQILAIKACVPVTDNHGNFIGNCCAFWICSACTGSDIGGGGQITPGSVSLDGESQGRAFFVSHESAAFQEWAKDYKALLASYGIESILGKTFEKLQIPMTGNKDFDKLYDKSAGEFNPPEQKKDEGVYVGGSRVANSWDEFSKMKPSIQDMQKYDAQVETTYGVKLNNVPPPPPNGEKVIPKNEMDVEIDHVREKAVDLVGLLPPGLNWATIAAVDAVAADVTVIHDCFYTSNCPTSGEVAKDLTINIIGDVGAAAIGDGLNAVAIKAFKSIEIFKVVENNQMGIAPVQEILHKANIGEKIMAVSEFLGSQIVGNEPNAY